MKMQKDSPLSGALLVLTFLTLSFRKERVGAERRGEVPRRNTPLPRRNHPLWKTHPILRSPSPTATGS